MKTLWELFMKKKLSRVRRIRMMKNQRSDTEKVNMIEEGKK